MNNLISFPSYMRDDHGLFYGGRLYRRGTAEIREAVSDRDWQRLYTRWMRKPVLEILVDSEESIIQTTPPSGRAPAHELRHHHRWQVRGRRVFHRPQACTSANPAH